MFLGACRNHPQPADVSDNTPKTDTASDKFFPIAEFLQAEVSYVDSTPLAILKCETVNKRTDSSFLTPNEFHRLAAGILTPELFADSLEKNFTETSFADKTTGYLTFIYSPKNKEQALQQINVLVSPGHDGANRVKSIYLTRVERVSDTVVVKKMFWLAGHSFQVITSRQPAGKAAGIRQVQVVWNNGEAD